MRLPTSLMLVVLAVLVGALAVVMLLTPRRDSPEAVVSPAAETIDCEPRSGPCKAEHDGLTLSLSLAPPIRPLQPLPLVLEVGGGEISEPRIAFAMVDMDMGASRYQLESIGVNRWQAEAILPICSAGRRDWLATVDYAAGGERRAVAFRFLSDP